MSAAPSSVRARVLRSLSAAAIFAAIALGAWYGVEAISSQPIRRVAFAGDVHKLARADLEALAQSVQGAAASSASLAAVREAAHRIPWVRSATVRRRFPDAVEIRFEAHEPLARWSEGALVSVRGEVFNAEYEGALPSFKGPQGFAASMAREYPAIARAAAPLAGTLAELRLSPRGAWQIVLELPADRPLPSPRPSAVESLPQRGPRGEGELTLDLGRSDMEARLARFAAAWPQLAAQGVEARRADLRYGNGFAVKKSDPLPPAGLPDRGRGNR